MIGRGFRRNKSTVVEEPQGFDAFELRLGDIMRGERATLGKSLLDVQRELKIKAAYVAAIENADPSAFDTPGFIAGYVRSYARYLNMDAEWAFNKFCEESGFATAHGMAAEASTIKTQREDRAAALAASTGQRDPFAAPATPFVPSGDALLSRIEPGAIGSTLVLLALIGGIGYGGYSVMQEVQRVQFAPVEQTPTVISDLGGLGDTPTDVIADNTATTFETPTTEALDRLYRPQALDVPVMVARDGPISTLDPSSIGTFAPSQPDFGSIDVASVETPTLIEADNLADFIGVSTVQVVDGPQPEVILFAAAPTWVRVRASDNSVLFEKVLETGEEYAIPVTEETPVLRAGNSGSLYFKVNGEVVGPAGQGTSTVKNVVLASADLNAVYTPVSEETDSELFRVLRELNAPDVLPDVDASSTAAQIAAGGDIATDEPIVLGNSNVSLVAAAPTWVRIRAADNSVIFEKILEAGEEYVLPATEGTPTLRAGNSGSLFFKVNGDMMGPAGSGTSTVRNVALSTADLNTAYQPVTPATNPDLFELLQ